MKYIDIFFILLLGNDFLLKKSDTNKHKCLPTVQDMQIKSYSLPLVKGTSSCQDYISKSKRINLIKNRDGLVALGTGLTWGT